MRKETGFHGSREANRYAQEIEASEKKAEADIQSIASGSRSISTE
jgi:hypothetical protein